MDRVATFIAIVLFEIVEYAVVPALIVWGWMRWFKRRRPIAVFSVLSLFSFALATVSAICAFWSILYARYAGGLPYYDPLLLKLFRLGSLASLAAMLVALAAVWRPSPLRWHALACAAATLFFWFAAAMAR
jgi:hypothetical protein